MYWNVANVASFSKNHKVTLFHSQKKIIIFYIIFIYLVHGWGLYADEDIERDGFVIEYVGEIIRQRVADHREEQ